MQTKCFHKGNWMVCHNYISANALPGLFFLFLSVNFVLQSLHLFLLNYPPQTRDCFCLLASLPAFIFIKNFVLMDCYKTESSLAGVAKQLSA